MTGNDSLPAHLLQRKAVVYVRQSTQTQVLINLESQRRQYELVEEAKRRGFRDIDIIDDDLGHSASGMTIRPGFDRLVALLCAGDVGAVLCLDASRLARNGRDWQHLLERCGLVEARVIDLDGMYNPCLPNDRLLPGMKGNISEFELNILRTRMLDAKRDKAYRGELRISLRTTDGTETHRLPRCARATRRIPGAGVRGTPVVTGFRRTDLPRKPKSRAPGETGPVQTQRRVIKTGLPQQQGPG